MKYFFIAKGLICICYSDTSNGTATLNLGDYYSSASQIRKEFSTPDSSATITSNIHISNSAGLLNSQDNHLNTVRPGISLYGININFGKSLN